MLDRANPRLILRPADPLPLDRLVIGRRPDEVAGLLARLFNLCGAAQGLAARLAMGLPADPRAPAAISAEIAREARFALLIRLPQLLDLPITPGTGALEPALFGAAGLAGAGADPDAFLASDTGIAPLLRQIDGLGLPALTGLAMPEGRDVLTDGPWDNSPAARRAGHLLLRHVEAARGRGGLWRALGRAVDACLPVQAPVHGDGWAVVPAARGAYGLAVTLVDGRVAALTRRTPTDHLLAPGGTAALMLDRLTDPALAPIALALFDPCIPVAIEEAGHA